MPDIVFIILLGLWSFALTYFVLFRLPELLSPKPSHGHGHIKHAPLKKKPGRPSGNFSAHEGFRSFARGEEVTVDDIVKGLSRDS